MGWPWDVVYGALFVWVVWIYPCREVMWAWSSRGYSKDTHSLPVCNLGLVVLLHLIPSMTSWQAKGSKLTSRCFRCSRQVSSFSSPRTVSCWKSIISMATVWSPPPCDRHGSFPPWAPPPLPYCEVKGRWERWKLAKNGWMSMIFRWIEGIIL